MQHKDTKSEDEISHLIIGASIYETQVLTYLRLTGIKLGLLVNFGAPYVKDGVSRIINGTL